MTTQIILTAVLGCIYEAVKKLARVFEQPLSLALSAGGMAGEKGLFNAGM